MAVREQDITTETGAPATPARRPRPLVAAGRTPPPARPASPFQPARQPLAATRGAKRPRPLVAAGRTPPALRSVPPLPSSPPASPPTETPSANLTDAPTPTVQEGTTDRWERRPVWAVVVRLVALAVPIGVSLVVARLVADLLPAATTVPATIAWWAAVLIASTAALVGAERVARRALPLAALLRLSLAFPDQVPNRFSVALRAATVSRLAARIEAAHQAGIEDEPTRSAATVLELVGALSVHDPRTRGHSERVRAFNDLLAEAMGLPQEDRDKLRWAALLHDIGKLGVSHQILNKVGKPTDREWALLKAHPEMGARIASPLRDWLGPWADAIAEHHERWDGHGYPHGLSGTEISLGGRIVAVADSFEVMTAPRPYKRPVSAAAARRELAACAGGQFDPEVVRAFLSVSIPELRKTMGLLSWLAQIPVVGRVPQLENIAFSYGRTAAIAAGTTTAAGAILISGVVNAPPAGAPPLGSIPPSTPTRTAPTTAGTAVHHGPALPVPSSPVSRPGTPTVAVTGATHPIAPPPATSSPTTGRTNAPAAKPATGLQSTPAQSTAPQSTSPQTTEPADGKKKKDPKDSKHSAQSTGIGTSGAVPTANAGAAAPVLPVSPPTTARHEIPSTKPPKVDPPGRTDVERDADGIKKAKSDR